MQTRTYGDLYKLIQSLAGVKSFAPSEQDDIANFINRRFFTAFSTTNAWPRYLVNSEERTVTSFEVSGLQTQVPGIDTINGYFYYLGDDINGEAIYYPIKTSNGSEFLFKRQTNENKQWDVIYLVNNSVEVDSSGVVTYTGAPGAPKIITQADTETVEYPWQVKKWTNGSPVNGFAVINQKNIVRTIEDYFLSTFVSNIYAGGGKTETPTIGEFLRVYKNQPNLARSVQEFDFFVDADGANIINTNVNKVYVTYKKPFTKFSVTSDYETSTVEVPEEFFSYIAHGAYADFLTMDGQTSKAIVESDRANEHLTLQLEKVDIMNNTNFPNTKFSTYVNRQAR
jgi:hypothetical protein